MADLFRTRLFAPVFAADSGGGGGDADEKGKDTKDTEGADDAAGGDDGDGGKGGDSSKEPDWKAEARKHERRSKEKDKKLAEFEEAEKKRVEETASDQEKAVAKARDEALAEARKEASGEVRADRLEAAVARLAAGKFADIDDALLRVQAAIRRGDLDEGDVFNDENRVQSDALAAWLDELLVSKKHLASGATTVQGDGDGGKGGDGGGKGIDDMSVEEHFQRISSAGKK